MQAIGFACIKGDVVCVPTLTTRRSRPRVSVAATAKTYDFSSILKELDTDAAAIQDPVIPSAVDTFDAAVPIDAAPDAPTFDLPDLPSMPAFEMPELPKFSMPNFSKVPEPDAPDASDAPVFEMPTFLMPNFDLPAFEATPKAAEGAAITRSDGIPAPTAVPSPPEVDFVSAAGSRVDDIKAVQEELMGNKASAESTMQGSTLSAVTDVVDAAGKSVSDTVGGAVGSVTQLFDSMTSGVRGAVDTFTSEVSNSRQNVSDNFQSLVPKQTLLPPELQSEVDAVASTLGALKAQFDEAPLGYSILGALLVGVPAVLAYRAQFSGYEGSYKPEDLADALQQENNIVVVDIRPRTELEDTGVIDLRRAARGKAASMPVKEVPSDIVPLIRNKRELSMQITAALICGLEPVNAFTKIVVLDSSGLQSKSVARAVSSVGYRGYVAEGGFAAWQAAGLDVKPTASYDVTAADVIYDKSEELAEVAEQTLDEATKTLSKPLNAAAAAAALVTLASTIVRPHETLQFLGVLGLELSVVTYLLQFDSPREAVESISESISSVAKAIPSLPSAATASAFATSTLSRPSSLPSTSASASKPPAPVPASESPASQRPVSPSPSVETKKINAE